MADAVTTQVLFNGTKMYAARFTNISDGTGESAVAKISAATLKKEVPYLPGGIAATNLKIMEIQWNIYGFSEVRILWDATTDVLAQTLSGNGYRSYWDVGGLRNTEAAGFTGDINFTTVTNASGNHYDIVLVCMMN